MNLLDVKRTILGPLSCLSALLGLVAISCSASDSGDAAPDAGQADSAAGGLVDGECIVAECSSRSGTELSDSLEGNRFCGADAESGSSFVQWMGPRGTCTCSTDGSRTLTDCKVITPEECSGETSCTSCSALSACAWCPTSGCMFRPALACDGGLATSCQ
jgi:hypothetical protein